MSQTTVFERTCRAQAHLLQGCSFPISTGIQMPADWELPTEALASQPFVELMSCRTLSRIDGSHAGRAAVIARFPQYCMLFVVHFCAASANQPQDCCPSTIPLCSLPHYIQHLMVLCCQAIRSARLFAFVEARKLWLLTT